MHPFLSASQGAKHPAMQDDSAATAAPPKQRLMLVTGMLGAGKTTALRALEDLGW